MDHGDENAPLAALGRELKIAEAAVREPGCGAIGNLECRLADLQTRFLAHPAASLGDLVARLEVIRGLVADLGPRGYLLDLVDAAVEDARRLARREA